MRADENFSFIINKLRVAKFKSLLYAGMNRRILINIPVKINFRIGGINTLTSGARAPGKTKLKFRIIDVYFTHTEYDITMKSQTWFVYIIENDKGHLYTGITTDLDRRFKEHASSQKGAKFFRVAKPVRILFSKQFPNRSEASRFECEVKKMRRSQKIALIRGEV